MMEYPEVVCMRDQMREILIGKRIERVFVESREKYEGTIRQSLLTQPPNAFRLALEGGTITGVDNICQTLLIEADTGHTLSLGAIYGAIRFHPTAEMLPRKKKPVLQMDFDDGTYLTVVISLFGEIRVLGVEGEDAFHTNPEPCLVTPDSERFTLAGFRAALAAEDVGKISAKKLLTSRMPVYYVDGLGGGYVQEILYRAKIHPRRKLRSLTAGEQEAYYRAIKTVTAEAIAAGGRYNERDLFGQPGGFVPHVRKETLDHSCPVCATPIERFRFEGGYCYVCPGCQSIEGRKKTP
jgi:formamidopyrimidine-DNA glycosylase